MSKQPSYSLSDSRGVRPAIDGASVASLIERYGSPLFVFSERSLRETYRHFFSAFKSRYPNVAFGWSYKTNYLKAICAVFHQEGAQAELVSAMELDKARALGVPMDRVVFNGPNKPIEALLEAAAGNARINIDHFDELSDLVEVAQRLKRTIAVGLRLNLDAGIEPAWSRFGFNLESGEAMEAARRISLEGGLTLCGLHCHIGAGVLDPLAYARQIKKMVAFSDEAEDRFGARIEYLDIGGGFPSRGILKHDRLSSGIAAPVAEEFAAAVCDALIASLRPGRLPMLIVESGRALIDDAGWLIANVVAKKRLPGGAPAYVIDAGVNLLYTSAWYDFHIETERPHAGTADRSAVYGPMCMHRDVIAENVILPPLSRGDRLIISPAGAYNNTLWTQFIEYRPNVVMVRESGAVDLIREQEDLGDLERRERLPNDLASGIPGRGGID